MKITLEFDGGLVVEYTGISRLDESTNFYPPSIGDFSVMAVQSYNVNFSAICRNVRVKDNIIYRKAGKDFNE